jgi:hypothetical protein
MLQCFLSDGEDHCRCYHSLPFAHLEIVTLAIKEITTNPWFQGLLTEFYKALLAQKVSPPWLPDIDDELDASYFGTHEEAEHAFTSKKDFLDRKTQRLFDGF